MEQITKDITLTGLRLVINDANASNVVINNCITQSFNYLNNIITEAEIDGRKRGIVMLLSENCADYIKSMDINDIKNEDYRKLYDIIFYNLI